MNKLTSLRNQMIKLNIDSFIILSEENRRYITNFTGSNGIVIISENKNILITDSRYTEQASEEAKEFEIAKYNLSHFDTVKKILEDIKCKRIGYESKLLDDFTVRNLKALNSDIEFVPTKDILLNIRKIKTEEELNYLRRAIEIADRGLMGLVPILKAGITEKELAIELEYNMKKYGSERESFNTIVVSGKRTSLPHGKPTSKVIENGDMVTIDFGAVYNGYHSDITRTLWFGEPSKKIQNLFDIVLLSQQEALKEIKIGKVCKEIDKAHRNVFIDYGVEEYSLRGLGHGIGLQIHELPRVVMDCDEIIEKNMIFTVEPGLYLNDFGGVRSEDVVIVKEKAIEIVTKSPKKIVIE